MKWVEKNDGRVFDKGLENEEGYFTLSCSLTHNVLTAVSPNQFELKGEYLQLPTDPCV